MKVYLGLGSNVGDREANLREAIRRLGDLGSVDGVASLWETDPVGYDDQGRFLNTAVALSTRLAPLDLLVALKKIERAMGRAESFRNAPRPIDIDIEFYANDVVADPPRLVIPHPRLHERRFVLEPLAELAPGLVHPLLERSVAALLAGLPPEVGMLRVAAPGWERVSTG